MTVRTRILEAASELLARSADADISTRAVCEAAGVTAPTLYHHFGDKEGLLAAVVDFGWAAFLEAKRTTGAALSAISQPDLFGDSTFTRQLREAVIAAVTVTPDRPTNKRSGRDADAPTIATAAATLKSKLAVEDTPLTSPERALMEQWL